MEASDKEIFELVMDAIQACKNLEKDGRDDHTDEDGPVHPRPSRQDVLRASISTIVQYVSDLNDPIVGKVAAQDIGLSERRILTGLLLLKSSRS